MDLNEAIAEVRRVTRPNDPWTGDDFSAAQPEYEATRIDHAIAAILNAVVSGDLVRKPTGWKPIATAPELDRALVAGWQPRSGTVAGYWWWHEDVIVAGRGSEHPEATLWAPIVVPEFPDHR